MLLLALMIQGPRWSRRLHPALLAPSPQEQQRESDAIAATTLLSLEVCGETADGSERERNDVMMKCQHSHRYHRQRAERALAVYWEQREAEGEEKER